MQNTPQQKRPIRKKIFWVVLVLLLIFVIGKPALGLYRYQVTDKKIVLNEVEQISIPSASEQSNEFIPGSCFDNCPAVELVYSYNEDDEDQVIREVDESLKKMGYTYYGVESSPIHYRKLNGRYGVDGSISGGTLRIHLSFNHNIEK